MNLSFLFWNLNGKALWDRLARVVTRHDVDIVMLAECPITPDELCTILSQKVGRPFHAALSNAGKLRLLTSLPENSLQPVFDDSSGRLAIRRLLLQHPRIDLMLAVVHFPSKMHHGEDDQHSIAMEVARDIIEQERRFNNSRTILVGDFNMNPFEKGIVSAMGLHGVMTRAIADAKERTIAARNYQFFYNPMWSCFGDRNEGPPGTFYYRKSTPISYFWNMFDQVLLRPEIMHWLNDLRILDDDGSSTLLDHNGLPDHVEGSDHLPLYFRLQP